MILSHSAQWVLRLTHCNQDNHDICLNKLASADVEQRVEIPKICAFGNCLIAKDEVVRSDCRGYNIKAAGAAIRRERNGMA